MNSKKSTIAVDLDDVLAVTVPAFVEFSNKRWNMNIRVEKYNENWIDTWGVVGEELVRRTEIIKNEFWHTVKHSDEALPVLKQLADKYKLVIATSRRREVNQHTKDWINKYFEGIFEEIHHSGIFDVDKRNINLYKEASVKTKAELLKELGADYIIDDHPKHCIGANSIGVKAILFGDYPWYDYNSIPKDIVHVKDWREVGEYFAKRTRQTV